MPDEPKKSANDEATLAVPGILCVSPTPSGQSLIHLGSAAGWMVPSGILRWEHELSFMARADMTSELARELHATLPQEQIAPKRFAMAKRAVETSPFLPLASNLVDGALKAGVRVHTVGVDRVSAEFYYFGEGGPREPFRVQGNLVEMLAPSVNASSTNADINALMEGLIDRLLVALSKGVVSELDVELADALPRLSRDGTGLVGTDLEAFDAQARALEDRSARFGAAARQLADAIATAVRLGQSRAPVPLYGEARQEAPAPLDVSVMGKPLRLPARARWTVTGAPRYQVEAHVESPPKAVAATAPTPSTASAKRPDGGVQSTVAEVPRATPGEKTGGARAVDIGKAPRATESRPAPAIAATTGTPAKAAPTAAAPVATAAAKPEGAEVTTPKAAAVSGSGGRERQPSSAKSASFVPMFLLLGFAVSVYFLWRDLQ